MNCATGRTVKIQSQANISWLHVLHLRYAVSGKGAVRLALASNSQRNKVTQLEEMDVQIFL